MREHFGPGWRMYFVQRDSTLLVMLGGGDKSTQQADISKAIELSKLSNWGQILINFSSEVCLGDAIVVRQPYHSPRPSRQCRSYEIPLRFVEPGPVGPMQLAVVRHVFELLTVRADIEHAALTFDLDRARIVGSGPHQRDVDRHLGHGAHPLCTSADFAKIASVQSHPVAPRVCRCQLVGPSPKGPVVVERGELFG